MTKAVTSVAAMQLVEQGKLQLDEPIGNVLPELAAPQVLEGFDASGAPRLRPAKRPITLRHLLTHTAGFGYEVWDPELIRYVAATGMPSVITGKLAALRLPLVFDPGERWEYGINIDWVGRAVEAVAGQPLDAYFSAHIFAPLGMTDTGFVPSADQASRLVRVHRREAGRKFGADHDGDTRTASSSAAAAACCRPGAIISLSCKCFCTRAASTAPNCCGPRRSR